MGKAAVSKGTATKTWALRQPARPVKTRKNSRDLIFRNVNKAPLYSTDKILDPQAPCII